MDLWNKRSVKTKRVPARPEAGTRRVSAWPFFWLAVLLGLGSLASWRWYFNNPPVRPNQLATISGALYSYAGGKTPDGGLGFYLSNSPLSFCVPAGDSGASFNARAFSARVRSGLPLTVTALRSDLRLAPSASNPNPLVCVYGLREGNTIFYAPANRIVWERTNRFYGLCAAWFFSALTFGLLLTSVYFAVRVVGEPIPQRVEWTPQYRLQIGLIGIFGSFAGFGISWLMQHYLFPKFNVLSISGMYVLVFCIGVYRCISGWRELRKRRKNGGTTQIS